MLNPLTSIGQYPNQPLVGGLQPNQPSQSQYFGPAGSIQENFSRANYGGYPSMTAQRAATQGQGGVGGAGSPLFDAAGNPLRPPATIQEAMQMQMQAAQHAQQLQQQQVGQAISALRYGLGLSLRNSPYSLAAMASPYLRDMSNANMSVQYNQPDYSGFASLLAAQQNQGAQQGMGAQQMGFPIFGGNVNQQANNPLTYASRPMAGGQASMPVAAPQGQTPAGMFAPYVPQAPSGPDYGGGYADPNLRWVNQQAYSGPDFGAGYGG